MRVLPILQQQKHEKKIYYIKHFLNHKQYNFGEILEANIYFENDFEEIYRKFTKNNSASTEELLIGFFDFYGNTFDH